MIPKINTMPRKPEDPIILTNQTTPMARRPVDRDATQPFAVATSDPRLVMPEQQPLRPGTRVGDQTAVTPVHEAPRTLSRRGLFGLAAGVAAAGLLAAAPKITELVSNVAEGEKINAAEARTQAAAMARALVVAARPFFSDMLAMPASPYGLDNDNTTKPYQLGKSAQSGDVTVAGEFGYDSRFSADSGLSLDIYDPQHRAVDSMASSYLEMMCRDATGAVRKNISTGTYTFGELLNWTEAALQHKDSTVPEDPADPNSALELSFIGVLTVDDSANSQPMALPKWYAVKLNEDAVYVARPGARNLGYDADNMLSKDWMSPTDPGYGACFKQTMAMMQAKLDDFNNYARAAR